MELKRVRTIDDIVFRQVDTDVTLPGNSIFFVEKVLATGIILCSETGERLMIDLETFENGFEAVSPGE